MCQSQIHNFLDQCVEIDHANNDGLDLIALHGMYVSWCLTLGEMPMQNSEFCTVVRHHGVPHDDERGTVRFYPGLKWVFPKGEPGAACLDTTDGGNPDSADEVTSVTVPALPGHP